MTSVPASSMRPASGSSKPAMRRSVVVLPEPDGPSSVKNSPRAMSSDTAVDRGDVAEAAREVDEADVDARRVRRRVVLRTHGV